MSEKNEVRGLFDLLLSSDLTTRQVLDDAAQVMGWDAQQAREVARTLLTKEDFSLQCNEGEEEIINRFVKRLPNLQSLCVVGDPGFFNPPILLEGIEVTNQALEHIDMTCFSFNDCSVHETDGFAEIIVRLRNLKRLDLAGTDLADTALPCMS